MAKQHNIDHKQTNVGVPFQSAAEAWFWFILAQQARNDGARIVAGSCLQTRPCEPIDILNILGRLHRNRVLQRDHLLVLRHYGRRQFAPDPYRAKEIRAAKLWSEAMDHLEAIFVRKGIVEGPNTFFSSWMAAE